MMRNVNDTLIMNCNLLPQPMKFHLFWSKFPVGLWPIILNYSILTDSTEAVLDLEVVNIGQVEVK